MTPLQQSISYQIEAKNEGIVLGIYNTLDLIYANEKYKNAIIIRNLTMVLQEKFNRSQEEIDYWIEYLGLNK